MSGSGNTPESAVGPMSGSGTLGGGGMPPTGTPDGGTGAVGDRTVHGQTLDGGDVVRYELAGKWYVEYRDGRKRLPITLRLAAIAVIEGAHFPFRPGGSRLFVEVRKLRKAVLS